MEATEAKRDLREEIAALDREVVELRREANYWKALHGRAVERQQALRERVEALEAKIRECEGREKESASLIEALKAKVKQLARMLFARKSEKQKPKQDPDGSETESGGGKKRKRRGKKNGDDGHGRRNWDELPTVEVIHDLPEGERCCTDCGAPFVELSWTEDSQEIDIRIIVVRILHKRKMYKRTCTCPDQRGLVAAPPPPKLIPKGLFTIGFWVYVILQKFLLQRPLARVRQELVLYGLIHSEDGSPGLSLGTLTGGLKRIAELVQPLYVMILAQTREAHHWHMDETRWMVFVELEGKTGHRWWLWVVVTQQTVCYLVDPSRSSKVPRALLAGAQGILNVDRYSAYKSFALENKDIQLAFCWAHVRRDFDGAATKHERLKGWAEGWVGRIGLAYKLNAERLEVRGDPEAFACRDRVLREAMGNLKEEAERELAEPGLHEEQKKVLTSLMNHWKGLTVFLDNPDVPMDNNLAERLLRNPVVGRKNYYGSGSEWSGHLAASLFSILATLQRNGINPRHYLEVYFEACAANGGKPPENIDAYQPWNLSQDVREAIERKAQHTEVPP